MIRGRAKGRGIIIDDNIRISGNDWEEYATLSYINKARELV